MICIGASDLRIIGRNTQGVRLFNLKEGDKLVSAAILDPEEELPEVAEGEAPIEGAEAEAPVAEGEPEAETSEEEQSE